MEVGSTIGSYRLERRLGRGGMGEVWLGRHAVSDGLAAVKLVRESALASLAREQSAIARLNHPNIVSVFEIGPTHLAIAYIQGSSLARRLQSPMRPAAAVGVALQIASALAHSHARGVVHRDIKPSNILLDVRGTAFLCDFGLATEADAAGDRAGTPAYMAPEQRTGGRVGHAADQYALARTLADALLSSSDRTDGETMVQLAAAYPPALSDALRRALSADPAQRWPSMREFAAALERADVSAIGAQSQQASPKPLRTAPRWWRESTSTDKPAHDIERTDYSLSALATSGAIADNALARFRAATGYEDLAWSVYAQPGRLGRACTGDAAMRASELVVLVHGWGCTRESWWRVASAVCRDNAEALVLVPDVAGFGECRLADDATTAQLGPAGIFTAVQTWLRMLDVPVMPTLYVGHSMAGLGALLSPETDAERGRLYRMALSPPLPFADRQTRWAFKAGAAILKSIGRVHRARQFLTRGRLHASVTRGLAAHELERFYSCVDAAPRKHLARIATAVASAPMPSGPQLAKCMVVRGTHDPLTPERAFLRAVAEMHELPRSNVRVLDTPSHLPHLEDARHPEWTGRNVAEIVDAINAMMIACRGDTLPTLRAGSEDTLAAAPPGGTETAVEEPAR